MKIWIHWEHDKRTFWTYIDKSFRLLSLILGLYKHEVIELYEDGRGRDRQSRRYWK